MYLRTTERRNADGTKVRYLQLAHNFRDPDTRRSKVQVIYNFGRQDEVDDKAIRRLISSLSRALPPGQALAAQTPELRFIDSRPLGGAWLLDQIWKRFELHNILGTLLRGRRLDHRTERVLFAMVCNRALHPLSKLSCSHWVNEKVWMPGLSSIDEDACYRAMDWLVEIEQELQEQIFWSVANLLNMEVDVLFFDTSSTYFETDQADEPSEFAPKGFRTFNPHSKDHRPDRPQIVIGMAVTRDGIPIRVWCWPDNASDQKLVKQVKDELRGWKLGRVLWAMDTGFNSEENRRYLQRAGGHYILGEKLRGNDLEAKAALSRQGRYHTVRDNLEIKEVVIDDGTMRDRFVICRNAAEAERDAAVRDRLVKQLSDAIKDSDQLSEAKRSELAAALRSRRPGPTRFLRCTAKGLLRIDQTKIASDQNLDGKYLLRTSDPTLSAEDVALGYRQLLQVERAWRDMKTRLELRPTYHRKEERIRAHVVLCWLALLLVRIAEQEAGDSWRNICWEMDKLHLGHFEGASGTVLKRTETTARQAAILRSLQASAPPVFFQISPSATASN